MFAWATGVALLLLVLVAMPLKYLADSATMVRIVAPVHGWLYVGYVVTAFVVAYRLRWSPGRTVLLLLAGTVPFMSFVAERRVLRQVRPAQPAADRPAAGCSRSCAARLSTTAQKNTAAAANSHHCTA